MQVWAHTLVKNEARYLWFAVTSVIDFVDKVLLWDTGSTDESIEIERELKRKFPDKIILKERKIFTPEDFPKVRQEMLEETKADWFVVVDGDEVWWRDSIKRVVNSIKNFKNNEFESVVVPMIYVVGDIFHKQEEMAGHYKLAGKSGNFALRGVNRKIPGLSSSKPHGVWGWTDGQGVMIQDRSKDKLLFIDAPYMHFSLVPRASEKDGDLKVIKRVKKLKYEIGNPFPRDYYYPEAFFGNRPDYVPSPWELMETKFKIRSFIETPLKKIKRRVLRSKVGY